MEGVRGDPESRVRPQEPHPATHPLAATVGGHRAESTTTADIRAHRRTSTSIKKMKWLLFPTTLMLLIVTFMGCKQVKEDQTPESAADTDIEVAEELPAPPPLPEADPEEVTTNPEPASGSQETGGVAIPPPPPLP